VPAALDNPYSVDQNLWGRANECGVLENPWNEAPEDAYDLTVAPEAAPDSPVYVNIDFEAGVPVALDGKKMKLTNNEDVKEVLSHLKGDDFTVDSVEKKERRRNAPLPYTTSSMQQDAANKINFRTRKTMMVAQQLYEGINIGSGVQEENILYSYKITGHFRLK